MLIFRRENLPPKVPESEGEECDYLSEPLQVESMDQSVPS